jgi:hypothetical protein
VLKRFIAREPLRRVHEPVFAGMVPQEGFEPPTHALRMKLCVIF